jgi:cobalt-zinc-cadmium efflux system outer membrane protein
MSHVLRSVIVMLVLLLSAAESAGQDPPSSSPPDIARRYVDPTAGTSLADLIALGLRQEPGVQAALLATDAARHQVQQAGLLANPSVSVERRQELGGMDRQWTVMAEWPLQLFRRGARVGTAEAEVVMAAAGAEEEQRRLTLEIEMQYGELLMAVRSLILLDELWAASRESLDLVGERTQAGAAPRVERDTAAVDAGRFEAQRALAVGKADAALLRLKRLLGLPPSAPLRVRETLEQAVARSLEHVGPNMADSSDGVAQPIRSASPDASVDTRPDVREALARIDVEAARASELRREGRFDLSVIGGYMKMDAGFPQQAFGMKGQLEPIRGVFHNAVVGAMVMVPLFNRNQGAAAAAETRKAAAEQTAEARRLQAASEIEAATARLQAARASLAVFTGALLETARRNLDVMREAYQLGRNTVIDVLAEHHRMLDLEMAYTDALADAFEAQAQLRAARGGVQP